MVDDKKTKITVSDSSVGISQSLFQEFQVAAEKANNGFHAVSLGDSLEEHLTEVKNLAEQSSALEAHRKYLTDHYTNSLSAIGNADKVEEFTKYGYNNDTLNWPLWISLYNDSWVFQRAIDKPAQDEINCGITINGEEDYGKIYKAYNRYRKELIDLLKWGSLFGGSVGVMMFDNVSDEEYAYPLKKDKIKGHRMKIYVTDRWYGCAPSSETVDNMKDVDFGKPKKYTITFADGKTLTVDHSYVLRYEHRSAPPLIKNGQLQGWGYAEGAHILNELSRDDQLKSAITSLVNKSLIEIIKMSGMRGVFMGTDKGNEMQLRKRLEMVNWGRTYNSLTFLDKDDEYQQFGFSGLAGLADLMEKNMWLIAAALEMQGILYGELKGGLSQDTDAWKRYSTTIENRCNDFVRPVVYKLFIMYDVKGAVDFEFDRLDKTEQNNIKIESAQKFTGFCRDLIDMGILTKYQSALAIKNLLSKNVISIQFTDENLDALALEEEYQILEMTKNAGKSKKEMLQNQFPEGNIPEKLDYLDPDTPEIGTDESTGADLSASEPKAETVEMNEQTEEFE